MLSCISKTGGKKLVIPLLCLPLHHHHQPHFWKVSDAVCWPGRTAQSHCRGLGDAVPPRLHKTVTSREARGIGSLGAGKKQTHYGVISDEEETPELESPR